VTSEIDNKIAQGWYGGIRFGMAMIVRSASSSASLGLPAKSNRRTSARFRPPSGLLRSRFSPAQIVSSFSWTRSTGTPPKTIAARRPLPMGKASFQFAAGCRYHNLRSFVGLPDSCANPVLGATDIAAATEPAFRKSRRVNSSKVFE
jgi:hypothetical protein